MSRITVYHDKSNPRLVHRAFAPTGLTTPTVHTGLTVLTLPAAM